MNPDRINSKWRRRLRLALLALVTASGLALAAMARYRSPFLHQHWNAAHGALLHVLLDPIRNRTRAGVGLLLRARDLWRADEVNGRLRRELTALATSNQILREEMTRMERLTGRGRWGGPPDLVFLPADVVGTDTYSGALLIVNRGRLEGVRTGDPAVALGGLVGVVRSVSSHGAVIQSVMDTASGIGVVSVGSSGLRARGVVYGRGRNRPLEFQPENDVQPIEPGAVLISSGFNESVYPKGLVIGQIESKSLDPYGQPYGVVRPASPMEGVEEVLLVLPRERARGQGLIPAFNGEVADAATSVTLAKARRPARITMPPQAIQTWGRISTATQELLLTGEITTRTLAGLETTSTLVQAAPTTATAPTPTILPAGTPYPNRAAEPPVPSVESFVERQKLESNDWPAEWQRKGGGD